MKRTRNRILCALLLVILLCATALPSLADGRLIPIKPLLPSTLQPISFVPVEEPEPPVIKPMRVVTTVKTETPV